MIPREQDTGLELDPDPLKRCSAFDDELAWMTYAQAAIPALLRADASPDHVAQRAAVIADAMLLQHRERWT
jgi:hypothetical protein